MNTEIIGGASLRFSPDERLAAAAGGVVRYFADAAEMPGEAVAQLQAATLTACVAAFSKIPSHDAQLLVEVSRFADRIEVAITRVGVAPEKITTPGFDRLEQESHNGATTFRLTKMLQQPRSCR